MTGIHLNGNCRTCQTGRTGLTKALKPLLFGIVIGFAAGVLTYCWIHIITTMN